MRAGFLVVAFLWAPALAVAADTDADTDGSVDTDTDASADSDTYPSGGIGAAGLTGDTGGCACNAGALSLPVAGLVLAAGLMATRRRHQRA